MGYLCSTIENFKVSMKKDSIDIREEGIITEYGKDVLSTLLREHAYDLDKKEKYRYHHIFWATDNYEIEGDGFHFSDEIQISSITGKYSRLVRPRADKSLEYQAKRTHDKAEVFTPSWICNAQNNLVDDAWFGEPNVFNTQDNHTHEWTPRQDNIPFPTKTGKTWEDYVCDTRIEISCGEAPYLVSRYDTTTGVPITLEHRIGILDRKLRVVGENVRTMKDWYLWAFAALKSTYGFEWQGDSLLLAREALLFTFIDYYEAFAKKHHFKTTIPYRSYLLHAAKIISWNIFQMDGLKMVLPMTCKEIFIKGETNLFETTKDQLIKCPGCKNNDVHQHNGIKQLVADWNKTSWSKREKPIEIVEFHTLIQK